MQTALRYMLKSYFEEYVDGLERLDCSQVPVTLRNLRIKEHKIHEEMEDSSFTFTDGMIGRVNLNMTWRGKLEVSITDVHMSFDFSLVKAMKKALLPAKDDEEDHENQVPMDVQQRLAAVPPQQQQPSFMPPPNGTNAPNYPPPLGQKIPPPEPGPPVPPRFCTAHDSSEKRVKGDPHFFECASCKTRIETNYAEAKLCPPCSEKEKRCMCCGADAPHPGGAMPGGAAGAGPPAERARPGPPGGPPPQPLFCSRHCTSEQRPKGEPQERECRACHARLQTNYAEFTLCPGCSQQDVRCMVCGADAQRAGAVVEERHGGGGVAGRGPHAPGSFDSGGRSTAPPYPLGSRQGGGAHWTGGGSHEAEFDLPPPPPPMSRLGSTSKLEGRQSQEPPSPAGTQSGRRSPWPPGGAGYWDSAGPPGSMREGRRIR